MDIEGVAGAVVVDLNTFTGKQSVTVGGQPVARIDRGTYSLPGSHGGMVNASVRTSLLDPYPVITIAGVKHRTGPRVPLALAVLALLPIALAGLGGVVGGVIGAVGVIGNLSVLRGSQSAVVKTVLLIAILGAAVLAWLIVAAAIT